MVIYPLNTSNTSDMRHYSLTDKSLRINRTAPFVSEADLVKKFKKVTHSNKTITNHISELDAGNGIADVVIYKQRKDWKRYSSISEIRPQWAYALIALPYRKIFDLEHFTSITCVSKATAIKILNEYIHAGFCEKRQNGWIKLKQPRAPITQIFAIEAKLRDWKKALHQAVRYLDFAHQSWVLLDNYYCKPAITHSEEFVKRNIGLLTINPSGELTVLIDAVTTQPRSPIRYWNANTSIMKEIAI